MSSSKLKENLPGFLTLYNGMPIILKNKNISTDLGITNGSQGFIRELYTEFIPSTNYITCSCAIVEFPDSKISLPDLPNHYFPVLSVKNTFNTLLQLEPGEKISVKVTRSQLPIQPAFAVTGHSAQGKTLPSVLTNLCEGNFGAYVAASRAKSRHGLYITEPVELENLNKPIPYNLLQEIKRLNLIEHNTYIKFGFSTAPYKVVIDPESEESSAHTTLVAKFDSSSTSITDKPKNKLRKRKKSPTPSLDRDLQQTPSKRCRTNNSSNNTSLTAGCTWCKNNWSCAYDCVIMSIFYAFLSFDDDTKRAWCQQTTLSTIITPFFYHLIESQTNIMCTENFNKVRDEMRNFLSHSDAANFPRFGAVGAPAQLIFDYLKPSTQSNIYLSASCTSQTCTSSITPTICNNIPTLLLSSLWSHWSQSCNEFSTPEQATIQDWIDFFIRYLQSTQNPVIHHNNCYDNRSSSHVYVDNPPPLLTFEVTPNTVPKIIPSQTITFQTQNSNTHYKLRAVIYHGNFHFTARLIQNEIFWMYDSQKNNGHPIQENFPPNIDIFHAITTLQEQHAHIYIYSL